MNDGNNRFAALIVGVSFFLLGMGSLVSELLPRRVFALGYRSGPEATILSIGALIVGVVFVYFAVKGLMGPKRLNLLGEPAGSETGLALLAQQYEEQGKTEESLKTLIMLYELQRDYEHLEQVQKRLNEFRNEQRR